jgi:hypothetical protein
LYVQQVNDLSRQLLRPHTAARQGITRGTDQMARWQPYRHLALHQLSGPGVNRSLVLAGKAQDVSKGLLGQVAAGLKGDLIHHLGDHLLSSRQQAGWQAVQALRVI